MRYRQIVIDLLTRAMTIAGKRKSFLLPASAILFAIVAIISRRGVSKEVWYAIILPGKLLLLSLCLLLLVIYISQSKNFLQKKISFTFGRTMLVLFLGLMLAAYLVRSFCFNGDLFPYIFSAGPDATSYFTQARIFVEGHINVPSHELKEFFPTSYFINNDKFFSMYPPGWPLILSLGVLIQLPWIINPILTCLSLGLIYMLGQRLYDRETAWIAIIFAGVSFRVIWGASNYFSEPATLLFSTLFFYAAIRSLETPNFVFPGLGGFCLGIVFLVRPYTAVAICLPVVIYWIVNLARQPRLIWQGVLLSLSFLFVSAFHFIYNYYQTGSPWLLPLVYYNPFNKPGFGLRSQDIFITPFYFGPFSALQNLAVDLVSLNWIVLPLLFLFILFVLIGHRKKWDWLLCSTFITIIVFHFFYCHKGYGRFHDPALFATFLLSARGVIELERFLKEHLHIPSRGSLKALFVLFPVLSSFVLMTIPGHIKGMKRQTVLLDPFLQVNSQGITDSIIFLKTVPEAWNNIGCYIQNSPGFDDSVLFVKDLGQKNILLMEYYPNRTYYRYEFDRAVKKGKLMRIAP